MDYIKKAILLCASILLCGHLLIWGVFYYSDIVTIPGTPINVRGLLVILVVLGTCWFVFRRCLRQHAETSLGTLTMIGGLGELIAEAPFQLVRQFSYSDYAPMEHVYLYLQAVLISVILGFVLAFIVAFQLKRHRALLLLLWIVVAIVIFNLINDLIRQ